MTRAILGAGFGLLLLVSAVGIYSIMLARDVRSSVDAKKQAEKAIQQIQGKMNEQGKAVDNAANAAGNPVIVPGPVPVVAPGASAPQPSVAPMQKVKQGIPTSIHSPAEDALKEMQ